MTYDLKGNAKCFVSNFSFFSLFSFKPSCPCYTKTFKVIKVEGRDTEDNFAVIRGENDEKEYLSIPLIVSYLIVLFNYRGILTFSVKGRYLIGPKKISACHRPQIY